MTNGISHSYHLDESTFNLRETGCIFSFLLHFSMKIELANRIAPDGRPPHLGLFCLHLSHEKDARLIWVKMIGYTFLEGSA